MVYFYGGKNIKLLNNIKGYSFRFEAVLRLVFLWPGVDYG
jgi:hypothetical protein